MKSYGRKEVLRGLSLEALPGEITMLVGENGAGKSTNMKRLAGLAYRRRGTVSTGRCRRGHCAAHCKLDQVAQYVYEYGSGADTLREADLMTAPRVAVIETVVV